MHEYSLVSALMDRVEREARARSALAVHKLTVRIGALAGVEPELFRSAFSLVREGTICADAELLVERVDARWVCGSCEKTIPPGEVLRCPQCATPARLVSGDEIVLDRIEMEVP
jgi:hydrogenase nickel incorporation protein HypA/HybF